MLDTILGILNLPTLRSAVPLEECHSRPDSGNIYSFLHRLSHPSEGMRLIAHICLEVFDRPAVSDCNYLDNFLLVSVHSLAAYYFIVNP